MRTVRLLAPLLHNLANPVVLSIGVGQGGLFLWLWRDHGATRIGIDVNYEVMTKARNEYWLDHFSAVVGDALHLPFPDCSGDIVVYDFVLHHLVGQGPLETALVEGFRVLRPSGFMISREPSSYSPSGIALNALNYFGLMHKLTGLSNQEFALSPPGLIRMFEHHGSVLSVDGLTYLFAHRLPPRAQDLIRWVEPYPPGKVPMLKVILGKSFKPDTNITVGSPAILLLKNLLQERGHDVEMYDPCVDVDLPVPSYPASSSSSEPSTPTLSGSIFRKSRSSSTLGGTFHNGPGSRR